MFIKLTNGIPETYTIGQLRRDNPQTSFPKAIPTATLAEYDIYPLVEAEEPEADHTKSVTEGAPVQINGVWTQSWVVADASAEEIAERVENAWSRLRSNRNIKLMDCDWTQVADSPVDQTAWAAYRQALRDLPANTTDPFNPVWPQEP